MNEPNTSATPDSARTNPLELMAVFMATVGGIVLAFMMVHIVIDVAFKYMFHAPVVGTLEIVSHYYMVIATFLPLALIEWRHEAIIVDVFFNMFPRALRIACVFLTFVLVILIYGALAYRGIIDALHAQKIGEMAMGSAMTVIWPSRWALPIGYGGSSLIALWFFIQFLTGKDRESWLEARDAAAEIAGK